MNSIIKRRCRIFLFLTLSVLAGFPSTGFVGNAFAVDPPREECDFILPPQADSTDMQGFVDIPANQHLAYPTAHNGIIPRDQIVPAAEVRQAWCLGVQQACYGLDALDQDWCVYTKRVAQALRVANGTPDSNQAVPMSYDSTMNRFASEWSDEKSHKGDGKTNKEETLSNLCTPYAEGGSSYDGTGTAEQKSNAFGNIMGCLNYSMALMSAGYHLGMSPLKARWKNQRLGLYGHRYGAKYSWYNPLRYDPRRVVYSYDFTRSAREIWRHPTIQANATGFKLMGEKLAALKNELVEARKTPANAEKIAELEGKIARLEKVMEMDPGKSRKALLGGEMGHEARTNAIVAAFEEKIDELRAQMKGASAKVIKENTKAIKTLEKARDRLVESSRQIQIDSEDLFAGELKSKARKLQREARRAQQKYDRELKSAEAALKKDPENAVKKSAVDRLLREGPNFDTPEIRNAQKEYAVLRDGMAAQMKVDKAEALASMEALAKDRGVTLNLKPTDMSKAFAAMPDASEVSPRFLEFRALQLEQADLEAKLLRTQEQSERLQNLPKIMDDTLAEAERNAAQRVSEYDGQLSRAGKLVKVGIAPVDTWPAARAQANLRLQEIQVARADLELERAERVFEEAQRKFPGESLEVKQARSNLFAASERSRFANIRLEAAKADHFYYDPGKTPRLVAAEGELREIAIKKMDQLILGLHESGFYTGSLKGVGPELSQGEMDKILAREEYLNLEREAAAREVRLNHLEHQKEYLQRDSGKFTPQERTAELARIEKELPGARLEHAQAQLAVLEHPASGANYIDIRIAQAKVNELREGIKPSLATRAMRNIGTGVGWFFRGTGSAVGTVLGGAASGIGIGYQKGGELRKAAWEATLKAFKPAPLPLNEKLQAAIQSRDAAQEKGIRSRAAAENHLEEVKQQVFREELEKAKIPRAAQVAEELQGLRDMQARLDAVLDEKDFGKAKQKFRALLFEDQLIEDRSLEPKAKAALISAIKKDPENLEKAIKAAFKEPGRANMLLAAADADLGRLNIEGREDLIVAVDGEKALAERQFVTNHDNHEQIFALEDRVEASAPRTQLTPEEKYAQALEDRERASTKRGPWTGLSEAEGRVTSLRQEMVEQGMLEHGAAFSPDHDTSQAIADYREMKQHEARFNEALGEKDLGKAKAKLRVALFAKALEKVNFLDEDPLVNEQKKAALLERVQNQRSINGLVNSRETATISRMLDNIDGRLEKVQSLGDVASAVDSEKRLANDIYSKNHPGYLEAANAAESKIAILENKGAPNVGHTTLVEVADLKAKGGVRGAWEAFLERLFPAAKVIPINEQAPKPPWTLERLQLAEKQLAKEKAKWVFRGGVKDAEARVAALQQEGIDYALEEHGKETAGRTNSQAISDFKEMRANEARLNAELAAASPKDRPAILERIKAEKEQGRIDYKKKHPGYLEVAVAQEEKVGRLESAISEERLTALREEQVLANREAIAAESHFEESKNKLGDFIRREFSPGKVERMLLGDAKMLEEFQAALRRLDVEEFERTGDVMARAAKKAVAAKANLNAIRDGGFRVQFSEEYLAAEKEVQKIGDRIKVLKGKLSEKGTLGEIDLKKRDVLEQLDRDLKKSKNRAGRKELQKAAKAKLVELYAESKAIESELAKARKDLQAAREVRDSLKPKLEKMVAGSPEEVAQAERELLAAEKDFEAARLENERVGQAMDAASDELRAKVEEVRAASAKLELYATNPEVKAELNVEMNRRLLRFQTEAVQIVEAAESASSKANIAVRKKVAAENRLLAVEESERRLQALAPASKEQILAERKVLDRNLATIDEFERQQPVARAESPYEIEARKNVNASIEETKATIAKLEGNISYGTASPETKKLIRDAFEEYQKEAIRLDAEEAKIGKSVSITDELGGMQRADKRRELALLREENEARFRNSVEAHLNREATSPDRIASLKEALRAPSTEVLSERSLDVVPGHLKPKNPNLVGDLTEKGIGSESVAKTESFDSPRQMTSVHEVTHPVTVEVSPEDMDRLVAAHTRDIEKLAAAKGKIEEAQKALAENPGSSEHTQKLAQVQAEYDSLNKGPSELDRAMEGKNFSSPEELRFKVTEIVRVDKAIDFERFSMRDLLEGKSTETGPLSWEAWKEKLKLRTFTDINRLVAAASESPERLEQLLNTDERFKNLDEKKGALRDHAVKAAALAQESKAIRQVDGSGGSDRAIASTDEAKKLRALQDEQQQRIKAKKALDVEIKRLEGPQTTAALEKQFGPKPDGQWEQDPRLSGADAEEIKGLNRLKAELDQAKTEENAWKPQAKPENPPAVAKTNAGDPFEIARAQGEAEELNRLFRQVAEADDFLKNTGSSEVKFIPAGGKDKFGNVLKLGGYIIPGEETRLLPGSRIPDPAFERPEFALHRAMKQQRIDAINGTKTIPPSDFSEGAPATKGILERQSTILKALREKYPNIAGDDKAFLEALGKESLPEEDRIRAGLAGQTKEIPKVAFKPEAPVVEREINPHIAKRQEVEKKYREAKEKRLAALKEAKLQEIKAEAKALGGEIEAARGQLETAEAQIKVSENVGPKSIPPDTAAKVDTVQGASEKSDAAKVDRVRESRVSTANRQAVTGLGTIVEDPVAEAKDNDRIKKAFEERRQALNKLEEGRPKTFRGDLSPQDEQRLAARDQIEEKFRKVVFREVGELETAQMKELTESLNKPSDSARFSGGGNTLTERPDNQTHQTAGNVGKTDEEFSRARVELAGNEVDHFAGPDGPAKKAAIIDAYVKQRLEIEKIPKFGGVMEPDEFDALEKKYQDGRQAAEKKFRAAVKMHLGELNEEQLYRLEVALEDDPEVERALASKKNPGFTAKVDSPVYQRVEDIQATQSRKGDVTTKEIPRTTAEELQTRVVTSNPLEEHVQNVNLHGGPPPAAPTASKNVPRRTFASMLGGAMEWMTTNVGRTGSAVESGAKAVTVSSPSESWYSKLFKRGSSGRKPASVVVVGEDVPQAAKPVESKNRFRIFGRAKPDGGERATSVRELGATQSAIGGNRDVTSKGGTRPLNVVEPADVALAMDDATAKAPPTNPNTKPKPRIPGHLVNQEQTPKKLEAGPREPQVAGDPLPTHVTAPAQTVVETRTQLNLNGITVRQGTTEAEAKRFVELYLLEHASTTKDLPKEKLERMLVLALEREFKPQMETYVLPPSERPPEVVRVNNRLIILGDRDAVMTALSQEESDVRVREQAAVSFASEEAEERFLRGAFSGESSEMESAFHTAQTNEEHFALFEEEERATSKAARFTVAPSVMSESERYAHESRMMGYDMQLRQHEEALRDARQRRLAAQSRLDELRSQQLNELNQGERVQSSSKKAFSLGVVGDEETGVFQSKKTTTQVANPQAGSHMQDELDRIARRAKVMEGNIEKVAKALNDRALADKNVRRHAALVDEISDLDRAEAKRQAKISERERLLVRQEQLAKDAKPFKAKVGLKADIPIEVDVKGTVKGTMSVPTIVEQGAAVDAVHEPGKTLAGEALGKARVVDNSAQIQEALKKAMGQEAGRAKFHRDVAAMKIKESQTIGGLYNEAKSNLFGNPTPRKYDIGAIDEKALLEIVFQGKTPEPDTHILVNQEAVLYFDKEGIPRVPPQKIGPSEKIGEKGPIIEGEELKGDRLAAALDKIKTSLGDSDKPSVATRKWNPYGAKPGYNGAPLQGYPLEIQDPVRPIAELKPNHEPALQAKDGSLEYRPVSGETRTAFQRPDGKIQIENCRECVEVKVFDAQRITDGEPRTKAVVVTDDRFIAVFDEPHLSEGDSVRYEPIQHNGNVQVKTFYKDERGFLHESKGRGGCQGNCKEVQGFRAQKVGGGDIKLIERTPNYGNGTYAKEYQEAHRIYLDMEYEQKKHLGHDSPDRHLAGKEQPAKTPQLKVENVDHPLEGEVKGVLKGTAKIDTVHEVTVTPDVENTEEIKRVEKRLAELNAELEAEQSHAQKIEKLVAERDQIRNEIKAQAQVELDSYGDDSRASFVENPTYTEVVQEDQRVFHVLDEHELNAGSERLSGELHASSATAVHEDIFESRIAQAEAELAKVNAEIHELDARTESLAKGLEFERSVASEKGTTPVVDGDGEEVHSSSSKKANVVVREVAQTDASSNNRSGKVTGTSEQSEVRSKLKTTGVQKPDTVISGVDAKGRPVVLQQNIEVHVHQQGGTAQKLEATKEMNLVIDHTDHITSETGVNPVDPEHPTTGGAGIVPEAAEQAIRTRDMSVCLMGAMFTMSVAMRAAMLPGILKSLDDSKKALVDMFIPVPPTTVTTGPNDPGPNPTNSSAAARDIAAEAYRTSNSNYVITSSGQTETPVITGHPGFVAAEQCLIQNQNCPVDVNGQTFYQPFLTPRESAAIEDHGGVGPLLKSMPVSPSQFGATLAKEGTAAALASIMPDVGSMKPQFDNFFKALESEGGTLSKLLHEGEHPEVSASASPEPEEEKQPALSLRMPNPRPSGLLPKAETAKKAADDAKDDLFGKRAAIPGKTIYLNGPNIWHQGTDLNLFQIVSDRYKQVWNRVTTVQSVYSGE